MSSKTAIIIGAGPAGLTAAWEMLDGDVCQPVILEMSEMMGGISRTDVYKGNRIDIGGHRFFSKSDRVMKWWIDRMPIEAGQENSFSISYQNQTREVKVSKPGPDPTVVDDVMLVRGRKSRIYYLRKFFDYPISLSIQTLANLGMIRSIKIGLSYFKSFIFPIRNEKNLEEFFINRFGRELYLTFFKSYTEKVWGVACNDISAEWGAQRIKGLSVAKAVLHVFKKMLPSRGDISQKGTETSLIEKFLYPKLGPGQMWETVADDIRARGGQIHTGLRVDKIEVNGDQQVIAVEAVSAEGARQRFEAEHFVSTMPIRELVQAMDASAPDNVKEVATGLVYRDFITVGLLVKKLKIRDAEAAGVVSVKDNWIYVQEPDVEVGRLQIFNNWSPYLVDKEDTVWIGLEYFCYETDELWSREDDDLVKFGTEELARIGIIEAEDVLDGTVIRVPKTYPAYFGTYDRFDEIRDWTDSHPNLYLVGRNGMHRYNNQDHSMLAAMTAVENIRDGRTDKDNIWNVNTEQEYHEEK